MGGGGLRGEEKLALGSGVRKRLRESWTCSNPCQIRTMALDATGLAGAGDMEDFSHHNHVY